ncbi:MAG: hypothetical protein JKY88_07510 [Pseudomonadales bacterium]|nr:hypothetical protein [Pseudomonadales bacterium]
MAIGVWEPANSQSSKSKRIDSKKVNEILIIAGSVDLSDLMNALSQDFIQTENILMKKQSTDWACLSDYEDDELELLARFFTLAEMQLTGWDGGNLSPVIYIVKVLKKRKAFGGELRKWIKASTDNRYLPNGAIL